MSKINHLTNFENNQYLYNLLVHLQKGQIYLPKQ